MGREGWLGYLICSWQSIESFIAPFRHCRAGFAWAAQLSSIPSSRHRIALSEPILSPCRQQRPQRPPRRKCWCHCPSCWMWQATTPTACFAHSSPRPSSSAGGKWMAAAAPPPPAACGFRPPALHPSNMPTCIPCSGMPAFPALEDWIEIFRHSIGSFRRTAEADPSLPQEEAAAGAARFADAYLALVNELERQALASSGSSNGSDENGSSSSGGDDGSGSNDAGSKAAFGCLELCRLRCGLAGVAVAARRHCWWGPSTQLMVRRWLCCALALKLHPPAAALLPSLAVLLIAFQLHPPAAARAPRFLRFTQRGRTDCGRLHRHLPAHQGAGECKRAGAAARCVR